MDKVKGKNTEEFLPAVTIQDKRINPTRSSSQCSLRFQGLRTKMTVLSPSSMHESAATEAASGLSSLCSSFQVLFSAAKYKQSRRFLECLDDSFLTQVMEDLMSRCALLDLALTNEEELVWDVKVGSRLGCCDYETLEFRIL